MRQLILFLVGLFMGVALTLVGMNYLRRGTSHADGMMVVMGAQLKGLDKAVEQNRCGSADTLPRLQTLRLVANDIEPAFADMGEDQTFLRYASSLRAEADAALAQPPASCKAVADAVSRIDKACDACHRDYKN